MIEPLRDAISISETALHFHTFGPRVYVMGTAIDTFQVWFPGGNPTLRAAGYLVDREWLQAAITTAQRVLAFAAVAELTK